MDTRGTRRVTASQVAFGQRLGLNLQENTVGVAWAKISDVLQREFWGEDDLGSPTDKQVRLAEGFGIDVSGFSRAVANAVIDDIMTQLNLNAIRRQKLAPGAKVRRKHDPAGMERVISSIHDDGTVYFRGGNGQRAWARNLERIS